MHLLQPLAPVPLWSFRGLVPPLSSDACPKRSRLKASSRIDVPAGQDQRPITIQRQRRSSTHVPSTWDFDRIQSLTSAYGEEAHKIRADKLKGEVVVMLDRAVDIVHQLELIDDLERLEISYHFAKEINKILMNIHNNNSDSSSRRKDLHAVALEFRILRQHGYDVPQGVFSSFIEESSGDFKACLGDDLEGMLNLYEASFLLEEGESVLEKARDFTTRRLKDYVNSHYKQNDDDEGQKLFVSKIKHALASPQHWTPRRVRSRWVIGAYDKRRDKNNVLLELAKLDFNMVQAVHQEDLKNVSRWWNDIGLAQKYSNFSRDKLMECFLWSTTLLHEPQYRQLRTVVTQMLTLITIIDDVYDNYGTVEELKLFTDAVDRWDIKAMEQLPDYMKLCFMTLFNYANNLAQEVMKKHEIDIVDNLRKPMADMSKAMLLEAKWYYNGYTPGVEEYIGNSWVSGGVSSVLVYAYFTLADPVTKEALKALESYHHVIHYPALILRLADDIGDDHPSNALEIPKSVQCYMRETDSSLEEARKHTEEVVSTMWTKLNKAVRGCPFPEDYVRVALNLARVAQQMNQGGDGQTSQKPPSMDRVFSFLLEHPIPEL